MSDEPQGHPLFPGNDDDDPETPSPEVCYILVNRREAAGVVTAPHVYGASDLTSLEQLHALYGGGIYELVGRGPNNARIVARRSYNLAGASKPLVPTGEEVKPAEVVDVGSLVARAMQAQQQSSNGSILPSVIALVGALGPVIAQVLSNSAAAETRRFEAGQQHMTMMLAGQQAQADKFVAVMQSLHNNAHAPAAGGGPGSSEFQRGVKWMEDFIAGKMEEQGEGGASGLDFNEMIKLAQLALSQPPPAPAAPVTTHLNGGSGGS